jgi:TolB-like protein
MAVYAPARQQLKMWLGISPIPVLNRSPILLSVVDADVQTAAFGAGLTDTLTAKLTQLTGDPSLQVVPSSEIRGKHVSTVDEARKEFGVNLVLEGSLHKSGQQMRVNYILVDARTRRQLRAQSLTFAAMDSFAAEDSVVGGAIQMLELEIQGRREKPENTDTSSRAMTISGRGYLQN